MIHFKKRIEARVCSICLIIAFFILTGAGNIHITRVSEITPDTRGYFGDPTDRLFTNTLPTDTLSTDTLFDELFLLQLQMEELDESEIEADFETTMLQLRSLPQGIVEDLFRIIKKLDDAGACNGMLLSLYHCSMNAANFDVASEDTVKKCSQSENLLGYALIGGLLARVMSVCVSQAIWKLENPLGTCSGYHYSTSIMNGLAWACCSLVERRQP